MIEPLVNLYYPSKFALKKERKKRKKKQTRNIYVNDTGIISNQKDKRPASIWSLSHPSRSFPSPWADLRVHRWFVSSLRPLLSMPHHFYQCWSGIIPSVLGLMVRIPPGLLVGKPSVNNGKRTYPWIPYLFRLAYFIRGVRHVNHITHLIAVCVWFDVICPFLT